MEQQGECDRRAGTGHDGGALGRLHRRLRSALARSSLCVGFRLIPVAGGTHSISPVVTRLRSLTAPTLRIWKAKQTSHCSSLTSQFDPKRTLMARCA